MKKNYKLYIPDNQIHNIKMFIVYAGNQHF